MQLSDYNSQVRELVHDLQTVDWADSELTNAINEARVRCAKDFHCVRRFFAGCNLIPNVEQYPIGGGVAGYTITAGGANYVTPVATVAAPTGITEGGLVTTATAVCTQTGGVLTSVLPTNWGAGYAVAPAVTITDSSGPGAGAVVFPIVTTNVLDIISLTPIWPGNTQSQSMNWSPFSEFQAWARMYRNQLGYPVEWTSHEAGFFLVARIPDQAYSLEMDAVVLPSLLVNPTDIDVFILEPYADAVQWWAAYKVFLKLQNFESAEYFRKAYLNRVREIQVERQTRRIRNIYQSTWRRRIRNG